MIYSFFDIDGPLYKKIAIYEYAKYLNTKRLFDNRCLKIMEGLIQAYDGSNYYAFASAMVQNYAKGIKGKTVDDVVKSSAGFYEVFIADLYDYATGLLELMKSQGLVVGISGTPIEFMNVLVEKSFFHKAHGTVVESRNGIYTGKIKFNCALGSGKEKAIMQYPKRDFAFADTMQDIAFMSKAKHPIAMNPDEELGEYAIGQGWVILNDKGDVLNRVKELLEVGK